MIQRTFFADGMYLLLTICSQRCCDIRQEMTSGSRAPGRRFGDALGLVSDGLLANDLGQCAQRVLHPGAGHARDQQWRLLRRALQAVLLLLQLARIDRVDLVQRDDLDLLGELAAIGLELAAHGLVGLAGMLAGRIDQMQQHAAALDVTEEAVAKARAFMRALDQPGNVGQHELAAVGIHHAELRMQRGEGIVRDLRPRRADLAEQGRFAGIGQPDETGIGDQFQPQPDPALLAGLARIGVARRAVGRGLEMRIAEAAVAAFGEHELLAELGEVVDQRLAILVEYLRADRHLQHDRLAARAMAILAHAILAPLGLEVLLVAIVDQRVQPTDRLDHDVAAAAAIAAGGPAEFDELLAAECHAAVAAVAGADIDLGLVEEFHAPVVRAGARAPQPQPAANRAKTRRFSGCLVKSNCGAPIPAVYPYRFMINDGGLISYGIDQLDLHRRAPVYVDRILRGANPADLPVQLPTKFEMAVNLKTARDLGLTLPATLIGRADEVIE